MREPLSALLWAARKFIAKLESRVQQQDEVIAFLLRTLRESRRPAPVTRSQLARGAQVSDKLISRLLSSTERRRQDLNQLDRFRTWLIAVGECPRCVSQLDTEPLIDLVRTHTIPVTRRPKSSRAPNPEQSEQ